ncbi:hypothetical protein [Halolamina salifodinae]|uniref:Uncharacterized protein n=1 Tax=Halolamina salifodinae TaxID=1202767 RepID=A0A8T4GUZ3_9EURY|nr:hypothetical protein [Halolamina salifodinae]MBP1985942.1 hypothetical protein [Halolamina salifodinae]
MTTRARSYRRRQIALSADLRDSSMGRARCVGIVAIAGTVGTQLLDAVVSVAGGGLAAPLAAANLGTIVAIGGSLLGLISGTQVLVIAMALLVAALVARRMD